MTFTDRASFDAELSNLSSPDIRVLDFENSSVNDLIPSGSTLEGITFTYLISDGQGGFIDMKVADQFDTTSGSNYLGLDDPGNFNQFIAGDAFNLNLGGGFNALGLYFITSDPLFAGDILLRTALGTAVNSSVEESILGDGGFLYFIGLVSPDLSFGLAEIRFDPAAVGTFLYNVDDIVTAKVPAPATLMLLFVGLFSVLFEKIIRGNIS
jgi:hypothetical protein